MMRLTRIQQAQLYIATAAAIAGAMANKGRSKPASTAHRAQQFAQAQLDEYAIRRDVRSAHRSRS